MANLIRYFQLPRAGRRAAALASAVVVIAALVALTFAVPSLLRPEAASAQTVCSNGSSELFNQGCSTGFYCNGVSNISVNGTTCSTSTAYSCNGVGYSTSAGCPTASYGCNSVDYGYPVSCSGNANAYSCNGVGYGYPVNCGGNANAYSCNGVDYGYAVSCGGNANAYSCNGVDYGYAVNCGNNANAYSCNGVGYSSPVNCSTSASAYDCNGVDYSYPVSCAATAATSTYTCNGVGYSYNVACPTNYTDCAGGGQVVTGQQCPTTIVVSSTTRPVTVNSSYSLPQGFSVSYAPGWNIVAGPTGSTITGNVGPLYSFQPGDTAYQVNAPGSPLTAGVGDWAYFTTGTTTTIGMTSSGGMQVQLPAGQYVMIGNSGDTAATVSGADSVLVYNPSTGSYTQTTQLAAGQGAWAISVNGGLATLTNAPI